jgi:hypothetical protein
VVDLVELRVQILLAEYEFVTGLIRYYREVELRALAGLGLLLTAVAAAVGAIESADEPNRTAEALLLAIAAWVPVVLVVTVLMAKTRGWRAVVYVRDVLSPRANALTGDERLFGGGEREEDLVSKYAPDSPAGDSRQARQVLSKEQLDGLLRGTPIVTSMMVCSLALAAAAACIALTIDGLPVGTWIAVGIGLLAVIATAYASKVAVAFTNLTDMSTQRKGSAVTQQQEP